MRVIHIKRNVKNNLKALQKKREEEGIIEANIAFDKFIEEMEEDIEKLKRRYKI